MFKSKSYQNRAVSASVGYEKIERHLLSKPHTKKYKRTYTESHNASYQKVKPTRIKMHTSGMQTMMRSTQKATKGPEQLVEQNLQLKVELNDLNSKLNITRSKVESHKKKHILYAKRLNRQFQKQLYWANEKGGDYMITGIKYQYEKVKEQLQQKCQQLQMARQTASLTNIEELTVYCESLQVQNRILIQNITYLKRKKKKSSNLQELNASFSHFTGADIEYLLNQQKKKHDSDKKKIIDLREHINWQHENQKQLRKKINFLQKLIIEKENYAHHASKKLKTAQRQNKNLLKDIEGFQFKMKQKQQQYLNHFKELKQKADRQAKVQKGMLQKLIREKNIIIQKLQKQIAYLSTLLSHWKPLDQLDRMDRLQFNSSQKDKTLSLNLNQSLSLHGTNNREIPRCKTPVNLMFSQQNNNSQDRFLIRTSHPNEEAFLCKGSQIINTNQDDQQFARPQNTSTRQPRRSKKRWCVEAKKNRKVQFSQIQHLGQLIKYKMIASRKSLQEVKDCFNYKLPKQNSPKLEEQLISMKQVKETLINAPFQLSQDQAHLLSRYIIEDEGVQYVYTHDSNQLQRSIVKSIIKTVVEDYVLPDFEKAQEEWKRIKKIYSHNMQLALRSICPKGTVSKSKFLQLMNSLGIETDEETKNYIIARMVQHQNSLKVLRYDLVFQPEERLE